MKPTWISVSSCIFWLAVVGCGERSESGPEGTELHTVVYEVAPAFLSERDHQNGANETFSKQRKTAREVMIEEGITFPDGAEVFYGLPISGVGLRNTQANHDLWQGYLDREFPGKWQIYQDAASSTEAPAP